MRSVFLGPGIVIDVCGNAWIRGRAGSTGAGRDLGVVSRVAPARGGMCQAQKFKIPIDNCQPPISARPGGGLLLLHLDAIMSCHVIFNISRRNDEHVQCILYQALSYHCILVIS